MKINITGYSVRAPNAQSTKQFYEGLRGGVNLTTDKPRYPKGYLGLPPRAGIIPDPVAFDEKFFKYSVKQAESLDPNMRMLLETTHEALMSSGINIHSVKGSDRTGVYVGHGFSDFSSYNTRFDYEHTGPEIVNTAHSMAAHKISFFYDFKGPSLVIDTACSSSLVALQYACKDIENGIIDRAVVSGVSLTLDPNKNNAFKNFNMLSPDGRCYSFDERANGYCRSEGIATIVIEREGLREKDHARAQIVGTGVNNDGFTKEGITYPSSIAQSTLAKQVLEKYDLSPTDVNYIECHGTGTVAGDKEELKGLCAVYPQHGLRIGSIKSNMGHAECASGLLGLVKCVMMIETQTLFPNFDFQSTPHEPIKDGRFIVVSKQDRFDFKMVQINNFGFGGTNAVAFLKPVDRDNVPPALVDSKLSIMNFSNTPDIKEESEYAHEQISIGNHIGFKYFQAKDGSWTQVKNPKPVDHVAFVFPGQGSHWQNMGKELYAQNTIFKETIDRLSEFYPGLNELYVSGDQWFKRGNSVFGIVSFQIAVTNILKDAGIQHDFLIGHSLGEIATAYAGGLMSEKEAMMVATVRCGLITQLDSEKCIVSNKDNTEFRFEANDYVVNGDDEVKWSFKGLMAVIGLESEKIQALLDDNNLDQTVVACYNSPNGQTVSGPEHEVKRLMELVEESFPGTFVRGLETANVAYHSKLFRFYEDYILEQLEKHVGKLSDVELSSVNMFGTCGVKTHNLMYHVKNITSPVYFQQEIEKLPSNTLIVEMGPSSPMITQIKRIRSDLVLCGTLLKRDDDNLDTMNDPVFHLNLYGHVSEYVHTVVKGVGYDYGPIWDHKTTYYLPTYEDYQVSTKPGTEVVFDLKKEWGSLRDHVVDDHNLFPAMGYIYIIWKVTGGKPVRITEYTIHEALIINEDQLKFTVQMDDTSISVYYDEKRKVSAKYEYIEKVIPNEIMSFGEKQLVTPSPQFYSWIRRNGYCYGDKYRLLDHIGAQTAVMKDTGDWIAHMDACLHMLLQDQSFMAFPVGIESLDIKCNITDTPPTCINYTDGELRTDAMTIRQVKMQPSLYNYKHNASVYNQVFVPFFTRVNTDTINEIFRFQASTYYSENDEALKYLKKVTDKSSADVVFTEEQCDAQFIVTMEHKEFAGYTGPVFTWVQDGKERYVYSKNPPSDMEFVTSWDQVDDTRNVCIVGNGANSFRKTFLKEYPDASNVWGSDSSDVVLPLTQHRNGDSGMWIERPVHDNVNQSKSGGYFLKFNKPGVLDSARWVHEGETKSHAVTYAALNFRDVMRAFGKLKEVDMNVGFEFAGVDRKNDRRVFGVGRQCIGTHCSPAYTYPTPDYLSDAEAATVPVVYLTAYYALFEKAHVTPGDSVLIHAGSGGVGQAAIQICQSRGINVFTTCHHSKREWLKEQFGLEDFQIGDSRSDAFVKTIMDGTKGKGVHCVINSLSGDLQIASVKCLRARGSFCEIGKYDIMQNTPIGQALFEKNISFHVIDLMPLLHDPECFPMWDNYMRTGFMHHEIKALPFLEYHQTETIQAFRDMSQAKHKGKIVVRFDDKCVFDKKYHTFNVKNEHHLITGGLGGLALCLGVRLSERGVASLTLVSRSGTPKTKWQQDRINEIESNGTTVNLISEDVTTFESNLKFNVIWHSATVYDDMMFKDMTSEMWNRVQNVKAGGYKHLRKQFPTAHIVNFSSIVSYLGNPGQTNYAWANGELDFASYTDTNTTTIQFGAVDNVGFIGKDDKNIKILQNAAALSLVRIGEMVDFIEEYGLRTDSPVFSCYGLAQKKSGSTKDLTKWTLEDTADLVVQVLGGSVETFVSAADAVLDEMGLDSLSRVELANMINDLGVENQISPVQVGQNTLESLTKQIKK